MDDLNTVSVLIRKLASDDFDEREAAQRRLVSLELAGLTALRHAVKSNDSEVARRAKECVEKIEPKVRLNLPLAVVRLLAKRRPAGTVDVLLDYLPFGSIDADVEAEIYYALNELAVRDGEIDKALLHSVTDKASARRAAAGCIIGRIGNEEQRQGVRKLLADTDPKVRLRSAQGLLAGNEKAALPALVELLGYQSLEVTWSAEELLHYVAGQESPTELVGLGTKTECAKCQEAWRKWWNDRGEKIDLNVVQKTARRPGLLLVCDWLDGGKDGGRIWMCGCDGKPRWAINLADKPTDVQVLHGNRVLIAEHNAGRVTERSLDGAIHQTYETGRQFRAITCRRFLNGHTLVGMDDGMAEFFDFGPDGEERYRLNLHTERHSLVGVQIMASGDVYSSLPDAARNWSVAVFDPLRRRLVSRTAIMDAQGDSWRFSPLASGHTLAAKTGAAPAKLLEADATGQTVRKLEVQDLEASSMIRLRSRHTLVTGKVGRSIGCVADVSADGRLVREWVWYGDPWSVRDCFHIVRLGFASPIDHELDPDSVANRVSQLRNRDEPVIIRAVYAIYRHGPRAAQAIPALLDALDRPDPAARSFYEGALRRIGEPAIPQLLDALRDPRPFVRAGVATVLGGLPDAGPAVVPALVAALQDQNASVRTSVARALGTFRSQSQQTVPALVMALADLDSETVAGAAQSIGLLGPDGKGAVSALLRAAKRRDRWVRVSVFEAMQRMGPAAKDAVPDLIGLARTDEYAELRVHIVEALGACRTEAKPAVPLLVDLLDASDHKLVEVAAEALGRIGPAASAAVPALIDLLQDGKRGSAKLAAVQTLGQIGPAAKSAIPVLKGLAMSSDADLRLSARFAIRRIER
jgi:HEAT repeat protein